LPGSHDYRRSTLAQPLPDRVTSSDTELWFLLALGAAAKTQPGVLDQIVRYRDGPPASLWDHALTAWRWVVERIGVGEHGLVKSWHGDWNDYLWPMGQGGRGESMMNTGMACMAGSALAALARGRGDCGRADRIDQYVLGLRQAAGKAFTGTHFVRGYTDVGVAVGAGDRVFADAQSWAALGGCGTADQRRRALLYTLSANATELGLCLVNPPLPSPPPADISSLPIPAGEGENGGVWPQAVAWFVWALADQGLVEQAHGLWRRMTLRHHYAAYPEVPFGIWGGPDCYNSHLAGSRAHWTQVQLWDRRAHAPMNPAVAWQAFARWQVGRTAYR
jgi:cellobiose phosphorylase